MGRNIRKSSAPRLARAWNGPTVLSYGFRPFFLLGPVLAVLAIANWLLLLAGSGAEPRAIAPLDWHIHEMLFGYTSAAIAGFLLTAVPNWTGRLPVTGWPLMWLALVWIAGRLAMLAPTGSWLGPVVEAAFLPLLAAFLAREVIKGRNWRNLKVLGPILLLAGANIWFHVEARSGDADMAIRLGFGAILLLIMLIGGRVTPSFTRNWLARQEPGRMPQPFNRFDALAMAVSALALLGWVVAPEQPTVALPLALAGALQALRQSRWAGLRCLRNPLLLVLHVFYGFIALGLMLMAAAVWWQDQAATSAALHLWGIGAIGGMTVAVSARATLGHTGRELRSDAALNIVFSLIALTALARALAAFLPQAGWLITLAGSLWIAAFALFAFHAGPWLLRPRVPKAR